jgi:hypothetical protein
LNVSGVYCFNVLSVSGTAKVTASPNEIGSGAERTALALLARYGTSAHVYLPGVGVLNGLQAANFLDSAGTTQGTVDQPVGLVLDAEGVLVPMSAPSTGGTAGWITYLSTTSSNGTDLTISNTGAGEGYAYFQQGNIIAGLTYRIQVTIVSRSVANSSTMQVGQTLVANAPSTGLFQATVKATNTHGIWIGVGVGAGASIVIRDVTLFEVTGIHASQSTTPAKPVLRRGAVNLLQYSQDFTNAAWVNAGSPATPNNIIGVTGALDGSTLTKPALAYQALSYVGQPVNAGGSYTAAFYLKSGSLTKASIAIVSGTTDCRYWFDLQTGVVGGSFASAVGYVNSSIVSAGNGWFLCTLTASTQLSTAIVYVYPDKGDNTVAGTVGLNSAALFQGTYTASQIQALGGIPLTTTAPASTALGPYWWSFDGVDDSLALSGPLFQMADDHCVIAGVKIGDISGAGRPIFSVYNSAAWGATIELFEQSGVFKAKWVDDAASSQIIVSGAYPVGALVVVCLRKVGNNKQLWIDGVQVGATNSVAMGAATLTNAGVGVWQWGASNFDYFSGGVFPVSAIKGTVTDSDLLTIKRFVGNLSGVTI